MNKKWWPHQTTFEPTAYEPEHDSKWAERNKWLNLHHDSLAGKYLINGYTYCFTDEKDMLHFLLVNQ